MSGLGIRGAPRPPRLRRVLGLTVAVVLAASCGVQPDARPRDIADEDQNLITNPSTGSDASGADRIFLVGPGSTRLLRSVPRDAVSPEHLIEILLLGPNRAELDAGFSTVLPATTRVLSVRAQGSFLFVDLTDDLNELTGQSLMRALAQIVYTASEIDGIEAVQILVDGQPVSWPKWNAESTTGLLRTYDYPGFVQTAQPAYPAVPSSL